MRIVLYKETVSQKIRRKEDTGMKKECKNGYRNFNVGKTTAPKKTGGNKPKATVTKGDDLRVKK